MKEGGNCSSKKECCSFIFEDVWLINFLLNSLLLESYRDCLSIFFKNTVFVKLMFYLEFKPLNVRDL